MTTPFQVDPHQLHGAGARWYALIPELQSSPPSGSGSGWPSSMGAVAMTGAAGEATSALQDNLTTTAGLTQGAAGAYGSQETQSAGGLKPGDMTGMMNDLIGAGTTLIQTFPQLVQSVTSAASSAASGGASAVASLVSALSHGTGGSPAASALGGNAAQTALPAIEGQIPPSEDHHDDQQQQGGD